MYTKVCFTIGITALILAFVQALAGNFQSSLLSMAGFTLAFGSAWRRSTLAPTQLTAFEEVSKTKRKGATRG